jgi:hypothetical protein
MREIKDNAARDAARKAAYERGWSDSLTAVYAASLQPWPDKYDYITGWWACADARRTEGWLPTPTQAT